MLSSISAPSFAHHPERDDTSAAEEERRKIDGYSDLAFNMAIQLGHLLPNDSNDVDIPRYQPSLTFSCIRPQVKCVF